MQDKPELKIDWASHDAAKYACENWHYSKCLPVGKLVKVGVWENEKFIGVVLFSRGASKQLGTAYDLSQTECCELTRVALTKHQSPVSRILAIAIKFLKKHNSGILLVVSFADKTQGHHGGIYQAGNWVYTGRSASTIEYFLENRWQHARNSYDKKTDKTPSRRKEGKHRYLMPLDKEMSAKIAPLAKPYPKRVKQAMTGDQPEQRRRDTDPPAPNIAESEPFAEVSNGS
jgi:hypothetical protein